MSLLHEQTDAMRACTQMMRGGSKSFFAASRVLPKRIRAPATALYAFCRVADDAVDSAPSAAAQAIALADLQQRLSDIYSGKPQKHIADQALAEVVETFHIPQTMLEALLEGFAWDAQGKRYDTLEDLHNYAARVAGTVGAMMALIMGVTSQSALARACELGAAMQLTNIARDVGEDARNGRLYLPLEWFHEENIDEQAFLGNPEFTPAIGKLVERLLQEADRLYWSAEEGIKELPRDCRMAIQSAGLVYAEIGEEVRRQGLNSIDKRAIVSTGRKLMLMARASSQTIDLGWHKAYSTNPSVLPAVKFLVDAGTSQTFGFVSAEKQSFYNRTVWVIDLCERLAQKDRASRSANMLASD
jgi:15-cis-phytoene synthase